MKIRLVLISIILSAAAWGQACNGTPDPRTWSGTWAGGTTFASCNVVFYAPNSSAYVSLLGGNIDNDPDTSPTWWTLLYSSPVYLQSTTPLQGSQIALDYNLAYTLNAAPAGVPYTGATGNVNLGTHSLTAQTLTLAPSLLMSAGTGTTGGNLFLGGGGQTNTTGTYNAASGFDALLSNTTGEYNAANGSYSLYSNSSGSNNVAFGSDALYNNTLGNYQTAIGSAALRYETNSAGNTAIGALALLDTTTGGVNTAVGYSSMENNTTGSGNSALGVNALESNISGMNNASVGAYSLSNLTTASNNSAIGVYALNNLTTGATNVGQGYLAGSYITGGSTPNQTSATSAYLGANTESLANGDTNEIVIGANAVGLGSNTAQIGTSATTVLGVGTVSWSHGSGSPGGSCVNGSIYTATNGTTTGLLWICGSSAWQSIK
jgi:hypothetical protein